MWQMNLPLGRPKTPKRPEVRVEIDPSEIARPRRKLIPDLRPDWMRQPPSGPGPSRIVYRLRRAWAKAWLRQSVRLALPLGLLVFAIWQGTEDGRVRELVGEQISALSARLSERPEFAVHGLLVTGASEGLEATIRRDVALAPGASSLNVDLVAVKLAVEGIAAVRRADVVLDAQGMLRIVVAERVPEALWRDATDRLWLIDREGVAVGPAEARAHWPDLPLMLGDGAPAAVAEALELFDGAPDVEPRLRAFVRVGERRWDLVLDRALRILLPEEAPGVALAQVVALDYGEEILDRDLDAIDMRVPGRPTFRMTARGAETLRLQDAAATTAGEET